MGRIAHLDTIDARRHLFAGRFALSNAQMVDPDYFVLSTREDRELENAY